MGRERREFPAKMINLRFALVFLSRGKISPVVQGFEDSHLLRIEVYPCFVADRMTSIDRKAFFLIDLLAQLARSVEHGDDTIVRSLHQIDPHSIVDVQKVVCIFSGVFYVIIWQWSDSPVSELVLLVNASFAVVFQQESKRLFWEF